MQPSGAPVEYCAGTERAIARRAGWCCMRAVRSYALMIAAWNSQVRGREVGNSLLLNLSEIQRNRARLKFAWEF